MEPIIDLHEGESPLILSAPHVGTQVPDDIAARLSKRGLALDDTDWHVHRLYEGLVPGATTISARYSRYVVDLNRPPDGGSLYPGQNTTGTCPLTDFDGEALYRDGQAPDETEVAERVAIYHRPYHAAIEAQIERLKARHGAVLLYDCHSIRSVIPYLFDGELPVLNIGTNAGTTCDPSLEHLVVDGCRAAESGGGYNWVLNGRFKGGWTTRRYGQPAGGVHAIQMETAQRAYLHEAPPWDYDPALGDQLRPFLKALLEGLAARVRELGGRGGA
ncbi:MAG: N-formylglutamate deformylase [Pseudomonadota bacterium]